MVLAIPIIALAAIVIFFVRKRNNNHLSSNAIDIARARYARGEITQAAFKQIETTIGNTG